jgi:hypothetical protein
MYEVFVRLVWKVDFGQLWFHIALSFVKNNETYSVCGNQYRPFQLYLRSNQERAVKAAYEEAYEEAEGAS